MIVIMVCGGPRIARALVPDLEIKRKSPSQLDEQPGRHGSGPGMRA